MMTDRKWLKLYVGWSDSEWLSRLEPGPRLCWPLVLEYVKCVGTGGTAVVRAAKIAAFYSVPIEWVEALLEGAIQGGGITLEVQKLTVLNWANYQSDPTAAERKKRHVESKKAKKDTEKGNALPPFQNVAERDSTEGTGRTTEKEKEKEKETTPTPYQNGFVKPSPEDCAKVLRGLQRKNWEAGGQPCWNYWEAMGWQLANGEPIVSWRKAVDWWHKDHPEKAMPRFMTEAERELMNR